MNSNNVFLHFLYLLSKEDIVKSIYLEGGFCLSFVYGIDRVFSQDIDFTIDDISKKEELFSAAKKILPQRSKGEIFIKENSIELCNGNKIIFQIDFYPLDKKLFYWKEYNLIYEDKYFSIKVHSLEDVFAEKISNIFQKDRTEFKDIFDINAIHGKLKADIETGEFKKYLHNKLLDKKIYFKTKKDSLSLLVDKETNFKNSYNNYPIKASLNFRSQFKGVQEVIKSYL